MDHSRSASEVGESGPPPKRQRLKAPRRGRPSGGRGGSRSGSSAPTVADGAQEDSADPPRDEIAVATAPAYDVRNEPISVSLERFRAWRKAGAPHDDRCFVCKELGELDDCLTCRRSYHEACKPDEGTVSQYNGTPHYFCDICVHRNWHAEPPLTPPASPPPAPSDEVNERDTSAPGRQTTQEESGSRPLELANPGNSDRSRTSLPNIPRTAQPQSQTQSSRSTPPTSQPNVPPTPNIPQTTQTNTFPSVNQPLETRNPEPKRTPARRSRYATLPPNVDSALKVLYCELEDAAGLRSQVSNLEAQLSQLRREQDIRERELLVMHQRAQKALMTDRQLRSEAAEGRKALEEAATLRAEKLQLEVELQSTREQLGQMTQTLQEWKQKLSTLIGD